MPRQPLFPIFRDHELPTLGFARKTFLSRGYLSRTERTLYFHGGQDLGRSEEKRQFSKSGPNESRLPRVGGDSCSQTIEGRG